MHRFFVFHQFVIAVCDKIAFVTPKFLDLLMTKTLGGVGSKYLMSIPLVRNESISAFESSPADCALVGRLSRVDPLVRHQGVLCLHHFAAMGTRKFGFLVLQHVGTHLIGEDAAHRALNLFQFFRTVCSPSFAGNAKLDVLFQIRGGDLPLTRGAFDGAIFAMLSIVHVLDQVSGKVVQFVTFRASEVEPEMRISPVHIISSFRIELRFAEFAGNLSFTQTSVC